MAQQESLSLVRISVRNLVEFVMRSGDLDDRRTAGARKEAPPPEDPTAHGGGISGRGDFETRGKGR